MTTLTSQIPAVITYLLAQAAAAYPATTHIFDGAEHNVVELEYQSRVWIGCDPLNLETPIVTGAQDAAALGARSRNETFELACSVEYWSGDQDFAAQRTGAFGLLAVFETLLRGTPATGGPGNAGLNLASGWGQIASIDVYQIQDNNGSSCTIVFHVAVKARLTTG